MTTKQFSPLTFLVLILFFTACTVSRVQSDSKPVTHEAWTSLLKKHVDLDGMVDYKGMIADSAQLNQYLALLESGHPSTKNWSDNEQIAYWINAYNAFTVRLIIRNYPVESIKELGGDIYMVNTPWDIKFIKIEDEVYDLNNIETGILRGQFEIPRMHLAVNCASYSCPPLRNEAYEANTLDAQLDDQCRLFINDPEKNQIRQDTARLSKIFKWYAGDFKENYDSVREFINAYSEVKITDKTVIEYTDYYWNLNEQGFELAPEGE